MARQPRHWRAAHIRPIIGLPTCHLPALTLFGRPMSIDPTAVVQKIVGAGRGGYCLETNALLGMALSALGYTVVKMLVRTAPPHDPASVCGSSLPAGGGSALEWARARGRKRPASPLHWCLSCALAGARQVEPAGQRRAPAPHAPGADGELGPGRRAAGRAQLHRRRRLRLDQLGRAHPMCANQPAALLKRTL